MSRKELMDRLFARVPASDREAFLSEIRGADTFDDRLAVVEKYNLNLTEEEKEVWHNSVKKELSDDELDMASGGCCSGCSGCSCSKCQYY